MFQDSKLKSGGEQTVRGELPCLPCALPAWAVCIAVSSLSKAPSGADTSSHLANLTYVIELWYVQNTKVD